MLFLNIHLVIFGEVFFYHFMFKCSDELEHKMVKKQLRRNGQYCEAMLSTAIYTVLTHKLT